MGYNYDDYATERPSAPRQWQPPFTAVLFNEADEPHDTVSLIVCGAEVIRNRMKYQLVEFSRDGAIYKWCGFAPTEAPTPTA